MASSKSGTSGSPRCWQRGARVLIPSLARPTTSGVHFRKEIVVKKLNRLTGSILKTAQLFKSIFNVCRNWPTARRCARARSMTRSLTSGRWGASSTRWLVSRKPSKAPTCRPSSTRSWKARCCRRLFETILPKKLDHFVEIFSIPSYFLNGPAFFV